MARSGKTKSVTTETQEAAPVTFEMVITELRVLSTSDRLLGLYELGIDGCAAKNTDQVSAVLNELIGALDFEYADIAEGFHRLYTYCLEQSREGAFDRVAFILQDLRDTLLRAVAESGATDEELSASTNRKAAGA